METTEDKIIKLITDRLINARKQRKFCREHNFEIENLSYNKLCTELEDLRFEIEGVLNKS